MEHNSSTTAHGTGTGTGTGNIYLTTMPGGGMGNGPPRFPYSVPGSPPKGKTSTSFGHYPRAKKRSQAEMGQWLKAHLDKKSGGAALSKPSPSWTELAGTIHAEASRRLSEVYECFNNYWPSFPGASAAETLDATKPKDGDKHAPASDWPLIEDLRAFAAEHKWVLKRSPSLVDRADQSLKGVAVVISDCNHNDEAVQSEMAQFVRWPHNARNFKLLVEKPAHNQKRLIAECQRNYARVDCIGADMSAEPAQRKAKEDIEDGLGELLATLAADGIEFAQELLTSQLLMTDAVPALIREIGRLHKANIHREALDRNQKMIARYKEEFTKWIKDFHSFVFDPERDATMLKHLDSELRPDQALFLLVGAGHLPLLYDRLMARSVVILSRSSYLAKTLKEHQLPTYDDMAPQKGDL